MKVQQIIDILEHLKMNGNDEIDLGELKTMIEDNLMQDLHEQMQMLSEQVFNFLFDLCGPNDWKITIRAGQIRIKFYEKVPEQITERMFQPRPGKGGPAYFSIERLNNDVITLTLDCQVPEDM